MDAERSRRLKAGAALARSLVSAETRRAFAENGYVSAQDILLGLDSDSIKDVLGRATKYTPPVTVAVYFEATDQVRFVSLRPGVTDGGSEPVTDIGGASPLGMLYDYLERAERRTACIRLTQWDAAVRVDEFAMAE